ncbi:MAG: Cna B-type domain-containing protein [Lachnospiraceae bacterium]|nr:Cna B-type domain-containing protein [Lachnospiraceae bacterium]
MVLTLFSTQFAAAATGQVPPHSKTITDNHDGTYTISLDVVGDSEKQPNNVNVIVIFDRSGSMTTQRMNAAKTAVNNLADKLYAYNTPSAPDTVQMALVSFSTNATISRTPTTSSTQFKNAVNALSADGGTNWEDALDEAGNVNFGDSDKTFVIFVSDGNPTFRDTRITTDYLPRNDNPNWSNNDWNTYRSDNYYYNTWSVYGLGSDNPNQDNYSPTSMNRCYQAALPEAQAIVQNVGGDHFFTIGAYGDVSRMQTLTTAAGAPAGNFYNANDTAALNQALADILAKIEMMGIGNTSIDDGTTNQVTTTSGRVAELLEVDTDSFKYYRSGGTYGTMQPWADAPKATFENGSVEWDLESQGVLENGVRYTVTFDCYPSQETYDTIAQLKNGDITYASLDSEIKKYIEDKGNGNYALRTNTNATLSWDDTRDEAGQQSSAYVNPDPVATDAETLKANKQWVGADPDVDELEITVLMDDKPFHKATISDDNNWETESFISIGIIKNGKVLPGAEGHDFKFAELGDEQYHWELESPVVHPMLINGTKTMLIQIDAAHPAPSGATKYTIKGKEYYADTSAAGLTAINHRRSNLNLSKVVTGEDAPANAKFPFTLQVNNSKAPSTAPTDDPEHNSDYWLWFSIYDTKAGATVTDATVSATGLVGPNADGYYYVANNTPISVEMKDGWNLRFINLPTGTTYTFNESLPTGSNFAFKSAELTQGVDSTFSGGQRTTGTIENTKTSYTVKYTNDYALTDLEITKVWDDNDNQDGYRLTADELKAKLTLSPAVAGKEPTVTDNGNGTYTITYKDLPRYNNGQEVEYTVTESAIDHYTTTGSPAKDHGTITNKHTPEVIDIPAEKIWEDANNQDGIRPTSVIVKLLADGVDTGKTLTLNAGNNWKGSFTGLEKFKAGTAIQYSIEEVKTDVLTGTDGDGTYGITYGGDMEKGLTVTNVHTPVVTKYEVVKVWNDDDNKDGHRPDELKVYLKADGEVVDEATLNDGNDWTHTWSKIPKYAGGEEIVYTASEDTSGSWVSFYETTTEHGTGITTITNSRESDKTTYKVVKVWDDNNNQDGIRPTSIQAQLYRDGVAFGNPVTLNAGNEWEHTWTGLEKNKKPETSGSESNDNNAAPTEPGRSTKAAPAEDKVVESAEPAETEPAETEAAPADEAVETETTEDADEADAVEPEVLEVVEVDETEAVDETDEAAPEQGDSEKREAPTRAVAVQAYVYTADEVEVPGGYSKTTESIKDTEGNITGIKITNKHVPETTTVTVEKLWDDANDQDGIRKDVGATVQLFKTVNGTTTEVGDPVDVAITDDWTYSWGDLPVNENGKQITYSVVETLPDGSKYTKSGDGKDMPAVKDDSGTTTITNSYTPETTKVTATKTWDDSNDQDGKRASVNATVQLYKTVDGSRSAVGDPVDVAAEDGVIKVWENLPVNENGKQITYSVVETLPSGSEYTKSGDDKTLPAVKDDSGTIAITNSYEPDTTDIEITKIWDDADNQDGYRPDADGFKAKLHLWMSYVTTAEDGTTTEHKDDVTADYPLTVTDNGDGTYTVSVDGLPMFKPGSIGSQITWTISEDEIAEYEAVGAVTEVGDGGEITNKHVPETMTMTVNKLWDDENDQDGKRDDVNATVQLYKQAGEGQKTAVGDPVEVGVADNWSKTWDNLPVKENGTTLVYSAVETLPDGSEYTKSGDDVTVTASKDGKGEITITNSYEPKTIDIDVTKIWDDENDQDGKRADVGATIQLYANGEPVGEAVEVGAEDDWSNEWTDLPVYEDGEAISYQVVETLPDGSVYTTTPVPAQTAQEDKDISFEVTNSYEPEKINITVNKEWDDADDQDGKRADVGATVQLYANDVAVGDPVTVGEADDWSNTWTGLPVYEDGEEISYKVVETLPDGSEYTTEDVDAQTAAEDTNLTFDITNSYEPKTIDIDVTKIWDDANDQDGKRADVGATIQLYANDVAVGDPVTVGAEDDWTNEWTDLPVYKDGEQISYKVVETLPDGTEYTTEPVPAQTAEEDKDISFKVTNSYEPKTIDIDVSKIWDDADDVDGKRADVGATIQLYANDVAVDEAVEVGAEDDWTYEWTDLPVYEDGVQISYKVVETLPDGSEYTTEPVEAQTAEEDEDISFEVTNSYTPEEVFVEGVKVWDLDGYEDDAEELMPESITVKLIADGAETPVATKVLTAEDADEEGNWYYKFEDLPKYEFDENGKGGKLIEYTVDEMLVPGFIKEIDGEVVDVTDEDQKVIGYSTKITNTVDVQQSANEVELNIEKVDEYGTPLKDVEFTLDNGAEGDAAKTITEKTDEDGVATITIPVEEGWLGTDEREQDEYTFNLTEAVPTGYVFEAEGESGGTNSWTVTVKWDGEAAVYTIVAVEEESEVQESYFERMINWVLDNVVGEYGEFANDKVVISNIREKIDLPVEKVWEEDPRYDIRPESITVKLLADGEDTGKTLVLKGSDDPEKDWKGTFKDLDKYSFDEHGVAIDEIEYTIEEVEVNGYETEITGSTEEGYRIINTMRFGDVRITKDLKTYETSSNQATFVYSVKATMEVAGKDEPVVVYDGVVTLDFTSATTASAVIKDLPAGAVVEVEETYSGAAYDQKSGPDWDVDDQTIIADEEIGVEFSNAYNGELTHGYGILNEYEAEGGSWVHLEEVINSNDAGDNE